MWLAENERHNIRQRQAEGIAAARARGVRFGRPPKPLPDNFCSVCGRWQSGQLTGLAAARECGMPMSSVAKKSKNTSLIKKRQARFLIYIFCKSTLFWKAVSPIQM